MTATYAMNWTSNLINVIPTARGGVWDFTHALAGELGASEQILTIDRGDAGALSNAQGPAILLHYSGYGYAKRGAPLWLVRSVSEHRACFGSLGVFFHELYAIRWPWSSAFWLSPVQQYVARRLAEMADFWMTTCEKYSAWLIRQAGWKPHAVLPLSSTIGEPLALATERRPIVVVFGSSNLRSSAYQSAGERLFSWAGEQGLEIHDVGKEIREPAIAARMRRFGVIEHGFLAHSDASALLATARYGIVKHRAAELAKSSIFAAYCAHGVCPIVYSRDYRCADGLRPGRHYYPNLPAPEPPRFDSLQIGEAAWHWYGQHRLTQHGQTVATLLQEVGR